MSDDPDKIVLKSGRVLLANNGVLGMSPGPEFTMTEGYDGGFSQFEAPLTREERSEIADMMIDRWQQWKARKSTENFQ